MLGVCPQILSIKQDSGRGWSWIPVTGSGADKGLTCVFSIPARFTDLQHFGETCTTGKKTGHAR